MAAMRAIVEPNKGKLQGVAARVPFDAVMERVAAPAGVVYEAGRVGGVSGWWCRPETARPGKAVMHIHGGWFNWGSAHAFRHFAGHIAAGVGVAAFVPDYQLAPEHPFPAAAEDVRACYFGLVEQGFSKIAITGDSAGGTLFVERAVVAGVDARLDVWEGMVHGYLGGLGRLAASTETLQLISEFLNDRFARAAK